MVATKCASCGSTKAENYGIVNGTMLCSRCTFLSLAGEGAEGLSNCPPHPPPEDGILEALEAAVDSFLENPQVDELTHDELTDGLARAFEKGDGEAANAMEDLLAMVLLPMTKMVRIHGLTGARVLLNGRLGILVSSTARAGSAPISLVPTNDSPAEWLNVKLTALRPASIDEFKEAVTGAIQLGKMAKFADLLSRPTGFVAGANDDDDDEEEEEEDDDDDDDDEFEEEDVDDPQRGASPFLYPHTSTVSQGGRCHKA